MKEKFKFFSAVMALFLICGSIGSMEFYEKAPVGSVVILIVSLVYLMVFIAYTYEKEGYTQEEFDLMSKEFDLWCFRKEKNESEKRDRASKGTQKRVHRSKSRV